MSKKKATVFCEKIKKITIIFVEIVFSFFHATRYGKAPDFQ